VVEQRAVDPEHQQRRTPCLRKIAALPHIWSRKSSTKCTVQHNPILHRAHMRFGGHVSCTGGEYAKRQRQAAARSERAVRKKISSSGWED
jgi:hypothetical protein